MPRSTFYKPKKRILFLTGQNKSRINETNEGVIIASLICNPQHSRAYSKINDIKVLDEITNKYLKLSNDSEQWNKYDDELCYSVICDRTKLEDSTSNQIAYFFNRDKKLMDLFINKFLGINVKDDFFIIREKENIDLFIQGKNNIIVIENKIDSGINGNQLRKYRKYISKNYSGKKAYFYILEPPYSSITEKEKNENGGKEYKIVYYDNLYNILLNSKYMPNGRISEYGIFLYKEFFNTIEYIQMSKASQQEKIAYTRLNQRINEKINNNLIGM